MELEPVYLASSVLRVAMGLVLVGFAVQAYVETGNPAMVLLAIGFALLTAATATTTISAFMVGFATPRSLLVVENGLMTAGFIALITSLRTNGGFWRTLYNKAVLRLILR